MNTKVKSTFNFIIKSELSLSPSPPILELIYDVELREIIEARIDKISHPIPF